MLIPQHIQIRFDKSDLLVYNSSDLILQSADNIPKLFFGLRAVGVEEGLRAEFVCNTVLASEITAST
jgi:hypothetical protein